MYKHLGIDSGLCVVAFEPFRAVREHWPEVAITPRRLHLAMEITMQFFNYVGPRNRLTGLVEAVVSKRSEGSVSMCNCELSNNCHSVECCPLPGCDAVLEHAFFTCLCRFTIW